jgi:single-strand DNA-binding protein
MIGVNKVTLIGNVGADPEVRGETSNVVTFRLATNSQITKENGEKEQLTEWHNLVAFGNLATIVKNYVKKGRQLYVEGRLHTRRYETEGEGTKFFTEIIANNIQFLDSKGNEIEVPKAPVEE